MSKATKAPAKRNGVATVNAQATEVLPVALVPVEASPYTPAFTTLEEGLTEVLRVQSVIHAKSTFYVESVSDLMHSLGRVIYDLTLAGVPSRSVERSLIHSGKLLPVADRKGRVTYHLGADIRITLADSDVNGAASSVTLTARPYPVNARNLNALAQSYYDLFVRGGGCIALNGEVVHGVARKGLPEGSPDKASIAEYVLLVQGLGLPIDLPSIGRVAAKALSTGVMTPSAFRKALKDTAKARALATSDKVSEQVKGRAQLTRLKASLTAKLAPQSEEGVTVLAARAQGREDALSAKAWATVLSEVTAQGELNFGWAGIVEAGDLKALISLGVEALAKGRLEEQALEDAKRSHAGTVVPKVGVYVAHRVPVFSSSVAFSATV